MRIQQIISELKQPFAASEHQVFTLAPGHGSANGQLSGQANVQPNAQQWFYIPWQKIRDRLDRICPDWQVSYSDPVVVSGYITVRCLLTVAGVTREATGSDKAYQHLTQDGDCAESTPDRATINAFMNAAAQFGIGDYLHDAQFMAKHFKREPQLPTAIASHSILLPRPILITSHSDGSVLSIHTQDLERDSQKAKKAEMIEVTHILRNLNKKQKPILRSDLKSGKSPKPKQSRASKR
jgi:hypothetical protein